MDDIIQTGFLYEVEKGDTLTSISKKFGTTTKRLISNNTLEDPNKIFIGQWLVIRQKGSEKMIDVKKVEDFEKLTNSLNSIVDPSDTIFA